MDEFFDIPTLIAIGVAMVVLWRLRSVLGTRTGNERSPAAAGAAEAGGQTSRATTSSADRRPQAAPVARASTPTGAR